MVVKELLAYQGGVSKTLNVLQKAAPVKDINFVSVFLCPNSYPGGTPELEVYGTIRQGPSSGEYSKVISVEMNIPNTIIDVLASDAGLYIQYDTDNYEPVEFTTSMFSHYWNKQLVNGLPSTAELHNDGEGHRPYPDGIAGTSYCQSHIDFRGDSLKTLLNNGLTPNSNAIYIKYPTDEGIIYVIIEMFSN